jgi:type I restriction enzyme S subunit
MGNEWSRCRLGDVVLINPEQLGANWPFNHLRYIDISSVGEGFVAIPPKYLALPDAPSRAKRLIKPGDTVISTVRPNRRSMFFVRELEPDVVVSTGFAVLRPLVNRIEPYFLYAYVFNKAFTNYLVSREKGAAYPAISASDIAEAIINLPPLPEQRAIAHILGALDDQIETLRRMNETLEGIARALFKAWFVDFEPVRAKMSGRWRRGQSLPGLPADLYDLFPDTLIPSELGQIPQGWQIKSLDEIADFLNGLALQKYPPEGSEFLPVIKIRELRDGQPDNASDKASVNIPKEYVINDGDVIFSWSGSLLLQIWHGGKGALNQHLFKVTSSQYPKWFYYHWIDEHLPAFQRIAASKATTMGHIQRHHLSEAKVVAPPKAQLKVMSEIMQPLLNKRTENAIQSRTLAALRDALLPELISGRLRLADAERFLQARGL